MEFSGVITIPNTNLSSVILQVSCIFEIFSVTHIHNQLCTQEVVHPPRVENTREPKAKYH